MSCGWIPPVAGSPGPFEVEHTTSIYSGVVRLLDLELGSAAEAAHGLFLVAPDEREEDVRSQLRRPAFSRVRDLQVRYLPIPNWNGTEKRSHGSGRG